MGVVVNIDTKALAAAVGLAQPVVDTACVLLRDLLGEPCKFAGALLSDQVYSWQWGNRLRVISKMQVKMREHQIPPTTMPAGFLMPVLEAVGNVDDEDLQDRWARLLAGAMTTPEYQHPIFVDTLRKLSSEEARLFDRICAECQLAQESPAEASDYRRKITGLHHLVADGNDSWSPEYDEQAVIPAVARLEAAGLLTYRGHASNDKATVPIMSISMYGRQFFWALAEPAATTGVSLDSE